MTETLDCFSNYIDACTTEVQDEKLAPLMNFLYKLTDELCTPESSIRENLLKNSKCMKTVGRNQKPCMKDALNAVEYILTNDFNATMKMELGCCVYFQTKGCMKGVADEFCGLEASNELHKFTYEFQQRVGISLVEKICDAGLDGRRDVICGMLPTPGTSLDKPNSKKFKSLLSRLIKSYRNFNNDFQ